MPNSNNEVIRDGLTPANDEYVSVDERMWTPKNLKEFQSTTSGKIIVSKRIFSAELECYAPNQRAQRTAEDMLSEHIGISRDGSLNENGVEFQTPKLKGKKGEQTIRDICQVLNNEKYFVNKDTGLHIHLDGKGLLPTTISTTEPVALKQLWQFYVAFDEVMLSFLPAARRRNRYCISMSKSEKYATIGKAQTQRDIEALWYKVSAPRHIDALKAHHYHDTRYMGVNLHSLLADNHLEIRFHSGTLKAIKILEWTALHQRIADMAAANELVTSEAMLTLPLDKKTKMFFSILGLTDRAQKYFMRRQAQFKDSDSKVEETLQASEAVA